MEELKKLAKESRVVAIGEIGLDRHEYKATRYPTPNSSELVRLMEIQNSLFMAQLKLAGEIHKPVILHSREVKEEVLTQIRSLMADERLQIQGVFHCFGGSKKYLMKILEAGFYVGFDGDITYVPDRLNVAKTVPLNRLLVETDSPYLSPLPHRGERNEPTRVKIIAKKQAEIRNINFEEVEMQTTANAEKLFDFVG
jgi:TatD DNase family protein